MNGCILVTAIACLLLTAIACLLRGVMHGTASDPKRCSLEVHMPVPFMTDTTKPAETWQGIGAWVPWTLAGYRGLGALDFGRVSGLGCLGPWQGIGAWVQQEDQRSWIHK